MPALVKNRDLELSAMEVRGIECRRGAQLRSRVNTMARMIIATQGENPGQSAGLAADGNHLKPSGGRSSNALAAAQIAGRLGHIVQKEWAAKATFRTPQILWPCARTLSLVGYPTGSTT